MKDPGAIDLLEVYYKLKENIDDKEKSLQILRSLAIASKVELYSRIEHKLTGKHNVNSIDDNSKPTD